jgi:DNA-directed RNA polymerase specialized sigma subunit
MPGWSSAARRYRGSPEPIEDLLQVGYLGVPDDDGRHARQAFTAYSLDAPREQIGDRLGISQMHVSRLLDRALTYLRTQITEPA